MSGIGAKSVYEEAVKLDDAADCATNGFVRIQGAAFSASLVPLAVALALAVLIGLSFARYRGYLRTKAAARPRDVSVSAATDGYATETDKAAMQRLTTQVRGVLEDLNLRPPTPALGTTAGSASLKVVEALPAKDVASLASAIAGLLDVASTVKTAFAVTLAPIDQPASHRSHATCRSASRFPVHRSGNR